MPAFGALDPVRYSTQDGLVELTGAGEYGKRWYGS